MKIVKQTFWIAQSKLRIMLVRLAVAALIIFGIYLFMNYGMMGKLIIIPLMTVFIFLFYSGLMLSERIVFYENGTIRVGALDPGIEQATPYYWQQIGIGYDLQNPVSIILSTDDIARIDASKENDIVEMRWDPAEIESRFARDPNRLIKITLKKPLTPFTPEHLAKYDVKIFYVSVQNPTAFIAAVKAAQKH